MVLVTADFGEKSVCCVANSTDFGSDVNAGLALLDSALKSFMVSVGNTGLLVIKSPDCFLKLIFLATVGVEGLALCFCSKKEIMFWFVEDRGIRRPTIGELCRFLVLSAYVCSKDGDAAGTFSVVAGILLVTFGEPGSILEDLPCPAIFGLVDRIGNTVVQESDVFSEAIVLTAFAELG